MLEGKSMPSNMAADANHPTLLKNQSALKYLPQIPSVGPRGTELHKVCVLESRHRIQQ